MNKKTLAFTTAALLSTAGLAQAQITVDDWTSFNSTDGSFSGIFNGIASDKIVIVATGEHGFNNDQGNLTSITYDGVSFTKAIDRDAQAAATDTIFADIWYLDDPGVIHTAGVIDVTAITRANITVLGLSGTADGVGNVGVTPTDTRSIDLLTSADSLVVASFSMGGAGNGANVNNVTSDSPLTQIAALENGSNWDGQVVGYENGTTAGTQTYSFTGGNTDGSLVIAAEFLLGSPPEVLGLRVNTTSGAITMLGNDTEQVSMNYYQITSDASSLNVAGWSSLADQDYEGNGPADNSGNGWEEAGGSRDEVLSEAYLLGSSTIAIDEQIQLGAAYNKSVDARDVTFTYLGDFGKQFDGNIEYFSPDLGDTDADNDVDTLDITTTVIGFTGAGGSGGVWSTGDFDGDGDVDTLDITTAVINFTGAIENAPSSASNGPSADSNTIEPAIEAVFLQSAASSAEVISALDPGAIDVYYDPSTGNITIDTDGVTDLGSFTLVSADGNFTGDAPDFSSLPAGVTDDVNGQIGWSQPFADGVNGLIDLGDVMLAGLTEGQFLTDLAGSQYSVAIGDGGGGGEVDLIYGPVPEPSSLALLALGGLAVMRRRR
jgi:hypothetical protein